MTCLEKLRADYPNLPDSAINAILEETCPEEFGYLEEPEWCNTQTTCEACWNREIPGTEKSMIENAKADMEKDMDEVIKVAIGLNPAVSPEELRDSLQSLKDQFEPTPRILDSGNRRQFESGAVRDIQEGKGRCDLLPLDVVAEFISEGPELSIATQILDGIYLFQESGDIKYLYEVLGLATCIWGEIEEVDSIANMLLEVAIHFEEGAKKYGDNNWRKGIPVRCYIDSAVRHYLKFLRGDKDEPHDRAFCWNIMCAIWTCKHKPELNEYGKSGVNYNLSDAFTHGD